MVGAYLFMSVVGRIVGLLMIFWVQISVESFAFLLYVQSNLNNSNIFGIM